MFPSPYPLPPGERVKVLKYKKKVEEGIPWGGM